MIVDKGTEYARKMIRKLKAHKAGKRTKVTYPNPNEKQKDRLFITVSGFDFFGDPKAGRGKKEKED